MHEMNGLFFSVEEALFSIFGCKTHIAQASRVSGGDINLAYRLTLEHGTQVFMKANHRKDTSFFQAEADGLSAIANTGAISVPHVLGLGTDTNYGAFLLLEWVERAKPARDYWEDFGRRLAKMHHASPTTKSPLFPGGKFGFVTDNYIGATPQVNTPCESWVRFFRDCRLTPQFKMAAPYFDPADRKQIDRLLERLDQELEEPAHASLLHGDLWSGNFITGPNGTAWLIDPAAYVGHPEADLAMTELFGGFHADFYAAYRECAPLQPGYAYRRDLYNLYHLLNHLNLFGGAYLSSVRRILKKYGGN